MHEIETARLRLRRFTHADLADLARIVADPQVMKYLGRVPGPLTRAEAGDFLDSMIAHWSRHGFGRWAVIEKDGGRLIGCAGLRSHEGGAELVYLLDKDYWGEGRATEAARACLRYGFGVRGFDLIVGFTRPANAASRRVMEKVGMRYGGEIMAYDVRVVRYEITREEYARRGGL